VEEEEKGGGKAQVTCLSSDSFGYAFELFLSFPISLPYCVFSKGWPLSCRVVIAS
jgi:hypothetical protein